MIISKNHNLSNDDNDFISSKIILESNKINNNNRTYDFDKIYSLEKESLKNQIIRKFKNRKVFYSILR